MPAPIVVEVYAPEPSPQELSVLIAACRRAAAPNDCISSDAKPSEPPLGVAIVRRDGDRAHIELGLRGGAKSEWSTRDLVFQPGDDELERYRAIGFAVGALVARETAPLVKEAAPPPEPEREPPRVAPPRPASRSTPPLPGKATSSSSTSSSSTSSSSTSSSSTSNRGRSVWVDAAGQVGLGFIPGPPRVGGSLRAAAELAANGVFAVAEVAYAERLGEPELRARWVHASVGLGHPLSRGHGLGVDLRLAFAVERMTVTALDDGRTQGAVRWKPGGVVAIDGHWEVAPPLGVLLSAATFIDPERTVIRVGGEAVGETPALGLDGFVGLRLRLK